MARNPGEGGGGGEEGGGGGGSCSFLNKLPCAVPSLLQESPCTWGERRGAYRCDGTFSDVIFFALTMGAAETQGSQWAEMRQRHSHEAALLSRVFAEVGEADVAGSVAGAFTCQLTMEPFREPVITPSGLSYERSALTDHLNKVILTPLPVQSNSPGSFL